MGQPGIALTDHGVMYGMPSLFKACATNYIQPVPGMEAYEAVPHEFDIERDGEVFKVKWADLGGRHRYYHITLWAMNLTGWLNLVALHTRSFRTEFHPSQRGKPLLDRAGLEQHNEGLMMGLGCIASRTNQAILQEGEEPAYWHAKWNAEVFEGRCYMELMGNLPEQVGLQRAQRRIAKRLGIPCVAVNDVHYLDRQDGVQNGPHHVLVRSRRFKKADTEQSGDMSDAGFGEWYGSDGFYLKSAQEMLQTGFTPADLEQSIAILDRVDFDFEALPEPKPPEPVVPEPGELPEFDDWIAGLDPADAERYTKIET
jgi:DNA polymerase-3 subunit alpha